MSDNRPPAYIDGDKIIYRASSIGGCSRALWLARQGIKPEPPNQTLQRAFDKGNEYEEPILQRVARKYHGGIVDQQREYELHVFDNVYIRMHIDGMLTSGFEAVVEAKAFGQSYFDKFKREGISAFPNYAAQVTCQILAVGEPCYFAIGLKDKDGNLTDGVDVTVYPDDEPPMPWEEIVQKVRDVEAAVAAAEMPGCDVANYWGCMYWPYHEEKKVVIDAPQSDDPETVDNLVSQYVAIKGQIDELEERKKGLLAALKAHKDQSGHRWLNKWVTYTKKGAINYNSMKEDGIDVEKYRKKDVEVSYPQPKALD